MGEVIRITAPLTDDTVSKLKSGDSVLITGVMYTGRDAAHKRMMDALNRGEELPFDIKGQIIYYVGPSPAKPGKPIGSAGPTTSYRMDAYAPTLIKLGLKGMIGKGWRAKDVIDACIKYRAVYFGATGGAGALISRSIKKSDIIAYDELGPEAVRRIEVVDFPAIVINDMYGNDLYVKGVETYKQI